MSRDSRPPEPPEHSSGAANTSDNSGTSGGEFSPAGTHAEGEGLDTPEFNEDALFELWRREEEYDGYEEGEEDEEFFHSSPPGNRRLLTLAVLVIAASGLLYKTYQPVADYFRWHSQEVRECGDPMQWIDAPDRIPELKAGDRCILQGTIANLNVYLLGSPDEPNALRPLDRLRGLSYLSRLIGTYRERKLFALHPAANEMLEQYKLRKQTLLGAELSLQGTLVDPDQPGPYLPLARDIRDRFRLAPEQSILLLDATDRFARYQWAFLSFALSCLIMLVVSIRFGAMIRALKRSS